MPLSKDEIVHLLMEDSDEIFKEAVRIRDAYCGNEAHIRGVIHFSNYCVCDDLYCGLRKSNREMKRFRMDEDTIVQIADEIAEKGIKTIVLQSGEDPFYTREKVCNIIRRIKERHDVAVTLSLGERDYDDYRAFRDAGADRYLMKHETMNEKLYERMRPGRKLKDRLNALEFLRKLGFQVGAGNIVGLPFQTIGDLVDDILFFQDFQPDMINIGPFIPHPQTPLKDHAPGNFDLMLRVFALTRIVTKNTHIAAANTVATLKPENGQLLCFLKGGCNVLMPNCNPFPKSKEKKVEFEFQCAPMKRYVDVDEVRSVIEKANLQISNDKGHSLKMGVSP